MNKKTAMSLLCGMFLVPALASGQQGSEETLDIYYIDTEGGQSTLFVSPKGESLLVDTGNGGGRDAKRILEAINDAGLSQIDHMWTTHYHFDHVGGLEELSKTIPVMHYYDHGPLADGDRATAPTFLAMYEMLSEGKRTTVKPGDVVAMEGVQITTVASNNVEIESDLPGGGINNPYCEGLGSIDESAYMDPDNGASAGFVMDFGSFRTVDLGDLTWNDELDLMCPTNHIGKIDLYLVSHHGIDRSNSPALVYGLQPRVAIMNNGTRKGGAENTFKVLESSPGLEDLWQLHWSHNVGIEHNAPGTYIANIDDNATVADVLTSSAPARGGPPGVGGPADHEPAFWLKVSAKRDGSFTVSNPRNGFSKTYR